MDAETVLIQRATPGTVKLVLFAVSCTLVTSALLVSRIYTATAVPTEAAALDLVGQIRPASETVVSAPSAVLVREIPVNVGDQVAAGQALLKLDDTEARTVLNGAQLARYAAAQQVEQLRHSVGLLDRTSSLLIAALADANGRLSVEQRRFEQVPVRQWKDSPERAAAAFDQAVVRKRRAEQLFESGIVSRQELEDAVIAVRIADNDLDNARKVAAAAEQLTAAQQEQARLQASLTLAEQRRLQGQRNVDLQNAELQLQRVDADLQAATRRFDDLVVRASAAGTVVEVVARPGDRLPAGSMLIRLATLDRLLVQVDVPTTVVNTIRKGQAVSLQLPVEHIPGIGHVRTIAPVPGSLGAHAVDVEFDNPEGMLLVGQTARARFRPLRESQPLVQQRGDGLTSAVAPSRGREVHEGMELVCGDHEEGLMEHDERPRPVGHVAISGIEVSRGEREVLLFDRQRAGDQLIESDRIALAARGVATKAAPEAEELGLEQARQHVGATRGRDRPEHRRRPQLAFLVVDPMSRLVAIQHRLRAQRVFQVPMMFRDVGLEDGQLRDFVAPPRAAHLAPARRQGVVAIATRVGQDLHVLIVPLGRHERSTAPTMPDLPTRVAPTLLAMSPSPADVPWDRPMAAASRRFRHPASPRQRSVSRVRRLPAEPLILLSPPFDLLWLPAA